MSQPRIGIVIGTTRQGRFGDKPAAWIHGLAAGRADMQVEIVDLRDYPMPLFDEPASPFYVPPKNEAAQRWGRKVAELDGFIFVTSEYNHAPPASLKNALDYAYKEFNRKPAAFVGYGGVGGARAVEHLRMICVELQIGADAIGRVHRRGRLHGHVPARQDVRRHAASGSDRRRDAGRPRLVGARAESRARGDVAEGGRGVADGAGGRAQGLTISVR